MSLKVLALSALLSSGFAGGAMAATVINLYDDPMPTGLSLSGTYYMDVTSCPGPSTPAIDKPCPGLDDDDTLTITAAAGYTFDLLSFWYKFTGMGDAFDITYGLPAGSFSVSKLDDGPSAEQKWTGSLLGLTYITFTGNMISGSEAKGLLDNFEIAVNTPATVPLPAAGWLLLGAFGGLAALKRRRNAA